MNHLVGDKRRLDWIESDEEKGGDEKEQEQEEEEQR